MRRAAPEIEPVVTKLRAAGISAPYASQLARKIRRPSLQMALTIWNATKLRFGSLEGMTPAQIRTIAAAEEAERCRRETARAA